MPVTVSRFPGGALYDFSRPGRRWGWFAQYRSDWDFAVEASHAADLVRLPAPYYLTGYAMYARRTPITPLVIAAAWLYAALIRGLHHVGVIDVHEGDQYSFIAFSLNPRTWRQRTVVRRREWARLMASLEVRLREGAEKG